MTTRQAHRAAGATDPSDTFQPRAARRAAARGQRGADASRPLGARRIRLAVFAAFVAVVAIGAGAVVVTRLQGPPTVDAAAVQVRASMAGFTPPAMTVKAGQQVKVEFGSTDTSMHSDGGGWHEFAIEDLGIDWKVGPLSTKVFDFTAPTAAGTYTFYCDVCCGGKENPSMRGTLTVTA